MFDSERIIFSILCITYLYSLYFLKGYYKIKHGTRRAEMYFNGNRFLFTKNILISIIIVIVALIDFLLKDDAFANTLGFGKTYGIITLIPILFFYHPHKGERNVMLDITTTILYGAALISFLILFIISGLGQVVL